MATIISIANGKGGVGKTTTAMNVAAGLNKFGKKVLLIDLDQQGNLSDYLGFEFTRGSPTISEIIYSQVAGQQADIAAAIRTNSTDIDYIPSSKMLATTTSILSNDSDSQTVLRRMLQNAFFNAYEYIILDCRPSLDLLVVNALVASDKLIIPVQAEKFSVDGIADILDSYNRVKQTQNSELELGGILITMVDSRTGMSREVESLLRERFGDKVFKATIPRLAEASKSTCAQQSLVDTKNSKLGEKYLEVVKEILVDCKNDYIGK